MSLHQQLMDTAYAKWNNDLTLSKEGFFDLLDAKERFAVFTGNLNYQVGNGGFSQWHFNGYDTPEVVAYLRRNLPKVGETAKQVLALVEEALPVFAAMDEYRDDELDEEYREAEDALCTKYYAINDAFMAECEAYLANWK